MPTDYAPVGSSVPDFALASFLGEESGVQKGHLKARGTPLLPPDPGEA